MQLLISIIRKPPRLVALTSEASGRPQDQAEKPSGQSTTRRMAAAPLAMERPLAEVPASVYERGPLLMAAWEYLGRVRAMDALTLFHLLVVQIETVPGDSPRETAPPLLPTKTIDTPALKPTAAHPRAFRGTTYKPPKQAAPPPMDLRPFLDDAGALHRLLVRLHSHRLAALKMLETAGYETDSLEMHLPDCDPYWVVHHQSTSQIIHEALPVPFRTTLLPQLKGLSREEALRFLAPYWNLQLGNDAELLHAVSRLVALRKDDRSLGWLNLAALQPSERRGRFVSALIETEAYRLDYDMLPAAHLESLNEAVPNQHYADCAVYFLSSLRDGVPLEYLLKGYRLVREETFGRYASRDYLYYFGAVHKGGFFPVGLVDHLLEHIQPSFHYYSRLALSVWTACGKLEGLGELLGHINWERLSPDAAFRYLEFYIRLGGYEGTELTEEKVRLKWRFVREQSSLMEALIAAVAPEYREKVVRHLSSFYWYWDNPDELASYMPMMYSHLRRICDFPYKTGCDTSGVVRSLLEHTPELKCEQVLNAPESSFLHLERSCLRENNARLVENGIDSLGEVLPEFTVGCFIHFPAKLFRTARMLGSLPPTTRRTVVETFSAAPIMTCDFAGLSAEEAATRAAVLCRGRISSPVPHSLQDYVSGRRSFSEGQIQRATGKMAKLLHLSRLEALEEVCVTTLEMPFGVHARDENVRHALQLSFATEENRRALRKFLKAYWKGDHDYILAHPLTCRWMQRHPGINMRQWLEGIRLEKVIEPTGRIRIAVEKDPLEALKLGTYVGSCLGLGGQLNYSAAAVALDMNKQVLYARNVRGHVLARQVVALSEAEELVCFSVYPASAPNALQQMFREYDILFSEALGVERYTPGEHDYTITNILSTVWWDDYPWQSDDDETPRSQTASAHIAKL